MPKRGFINGCHGCVQLTTSVAGNHLKNRNVLDLKFTQCIDQKDDLCVLEFYRPKNNFDDHVFLQVPNFPRACTSDDVENCFSEKHPIQKPRGAIGNTNPQREHVFFSTVNQGSSYNSGGDLDHGR